MTRIFPLLLLTLWPLVAGLETDEAVSRFREGNASFQAGDFDGAVKAYEGLIGGGYGSGTLYYNLGNAYYRKGDIARAILNYERARRWMPGDEDLRHNLEVARAMIVDRIGPVPRLFYVEAWEEVRDRFSIGLMVAIGFGAYLILLAGLVLFLLARGFRARRYGVAAGSISLAILSLVIVILSARYSSIRSGDMGVILSGLVEVKNAPDPSGPDAFILHSGTVVRITDRVGEWLQIRLEDGKIGWISADGLEVI